MIVRKPGVKAKSAVIGLLEGGPPDGRSVVGREDLPYSRSYGT